MRFHLLALPNAPTTRAYSLDGFSQATRRFSKLLKKLGHHVILYGCEENDAPCDELVPCITEEERNILLKGCPYQYASTDGRYALWAQANPRMIVEIQARKQPRDFIALIGGTSQKSITEAHPDLISLEYSIGYVSCFSQYRVYESHCWRSMVSGLEGNWDGRFFDTVIPLFFDREDFPYVEKPEPYALYVGRLTPKKGLAIACEAAEKAGMPLKIIGHGDTSLITHGAEYLGEVDDIARNKMMANATCLLAPTLYIEPFCAAAVEAQMCGTPAITTDFGGFVETVIPGVTGFRCNTLGDFVGAIKKADQLPRPIIRDMAISRFSIEAVQDQYQSYFDRLMLLWDKGWNTL